jgi:hypothetical protein
VGDGEAAAAVTVTTGPAPPRRRYPTHDAGIALSPTSLNLFVNSFLTPGFDVETTASSPSGAILSSLFEPISFSPGARDSAGGIVTERGGVVSSEISYSASPIKIKPNRNLGSRAFHLGSAVLELRRLSNVAQDRLAYRLIIAAFRRWRDRAVFLFALRIVDPQENPAAGRDGASCGGPAAAQAVRVDQPIISGDGSPSQ